MKPASCLLPQARRGDAHPSPARMLKAVMTLLACTPLLAQELQVGLDRQSPRALQINPPGGALRLDSAASVAPAIRLGWDLWRPLDHQALELTAGLRLPSEHQLTFANSVGASGNVQARLRLDAQGAIGALYRFEHPFGLPLAAGLGVEARRERLVLKEGALTSAGTLHRPWFRAVLRHRFEALGPFVALEWARPLTSAPTPSGVDYLLDLDHLGSSPNPGTAAKAHAPTFSLTLAVGYRFGRRSPAVRVVDMNEGGPTGRFAPSTSPLVLPHVVAIPAQGPDQPIASNDSLEGRTPRNLPKPRP